MKLFFSSIFISVSLLQPFISVAQKRTIDQRVDSVLKLMTLEEKIGQLNQYNDDWNATGPVTLDSTKKQQVLKGQVGSLLNCVGTVRTRAWQNIAMKSRLKIPLLLGQDVIHGYKTTFPIPLAEACSWDIDAIQLAARTAATEASAASVLITNTGEKEGTETVQLYISDMVASVVRSVKELKGFQEIGLKAGESKKVSFSLITRDLKFYNAGLKYDWEPGDFEIMIRGNSKDVKNAKVH